MSDFRLKVFQSVAKNLSFTKASQELFVSQPAITKHIQELETYYQARLFDRQGSKISLTKAGELLLKHSEKILDDYKQLEYEMHLLHNEYIGELKLCQYYDCAICTSSSVSELYSQVSANQSFFD